MQLKNTKDHFGMIHRLFHWSMGALIIGLLVLGFYMGGSSLEWKGFLYGMHKATGILVLCLVIARIGWRVSNISPALPENLQPFHHMAARLSVWILYGSMVAMPILGYLTSTAGGHPVSFYGLFNIPSLVPKNFQLSHLAGEAHGILGWFLTGFIVLHIAAALYHHFYLKDNVLSRMLRSPQ